ncbi:hypothetical protein Tco_1335485 [Tanacetum coccineum]
MCCFLLRGFDNRYLRQREVSRGSFSVRFSGRSGRYSAWATRSTAGVFGFVGFLDKEHNQQGLVAALEELPAATIAAYDNVIQKKAFSSLILCLGDRVLREITKETTAAGIWKNQALKHIDEFQQMLEDSVRDTSLGNLQKMTEAKVMVVKVLCKGEFGRGIWRGGGSYHITYMRDYLVDLKSMMVVIICLLVMAGNDVYEGQRSTQQCTKSEVAKHLGVAGLQQQNGLVKETNVTLLAKGCLEQVRSKCIFLGYHKGIVGNKLEGLILDEFTSKVRVQCRCREDLSLRNASGYYIEVNACTGLPEIYLCL